MAWQANFGTLLRSDSLLRLWRYLLLAYLKIMFLNIRNATQVICSLNFNKYF